MAGGKGRAEKASRLAELVFIMDCSSSMVDLEPAVIAGFNGMLQEQRIKRRAVLISTVLFNSRIKFLHDRATTATIADMTERDYCPQGGAALLDAMGGAIDHIRKLHEAASPARRPARTMVIIMTEGRENASCRYTAEKVRALVQQQEERGWEFIFLGADIEAMKVADGLGIPLDHAVQYEANPAGCRSSWSTLGNLAQVFAAGTMLDVHWQTGIGAKIKASRKKRAAHKAVKREESSDSDGSCA